MKELSGVVRVCALALLFLFPPNPANAATYYFSNSAGGYIPIVGANSNAGTLSAPKHTFKTSTLAGTSGLAPGDVVYFDCGDSWEGSAAEVVVNSNGLSNNRITIAGYGCTGQEWVRFYGSPVTASGWAYTGANNIYTLSGQTQTHLKTVYQGNVTRGLGKWRGSVTTLPEGTFMRSGSTLYVHLWNHDDPSTASVRVGNFSHSVGDGSRGLIATSRNSGLGDYITFKRIWSIGANGVGFSSSGRDARCEDCRVTAAGMDGALAYSELTMSGEYGEGLWFYGTTNPLLAGEQSAGCIVEWSAANGGGFGQGVTTYASGFWIKNCVVRNNFMAGIDFLDFGVNSQVNNSGAVHNLVYDNGRWQDGSGSYDANIYVDGANNVFIYGNIVYGSGRVTGATNAREGIKIGTEHPATKPTHHVWVVNNLVYGNHYIALGTDNAPWDPAQNIPNIRDIYYINNTLAAYDAGSFEMVLGFTDLEASPNILLARNNIFIADNSAEVNAFVSSYLDRFDFDYNLYFRRGGSTVVYKVASNNCTLPAWQGTTPACGSGEDANSIFADPLVVRDADAAFDARLQRIAEGFPLDSPAIDRGHSNPYVPPLFVPAEILPNGGAIAGTTRVDGAPDDSNLDLGFHYPTGSSGGCGSDTVPPTVIITSPEDGATLPAWSTVQIHATVTDNCDPDVTNVALLWTNSSGTITMPCPSNTANWGCEKDGPQFTWWINVGDGQRQYQVRATDSAGNTTITPQRTLYLGTGPDTTPPTVTVTSPADGATLPAYTTIQINATVTDDRDSDVTNVSLLWTNTAATTTMPCPSSTANWSCVKSGSQFTWSINVGEGQRQYRIQAVDSSLNATMTAQRTVYLVP